MVVWSDVGGDARVRREASTLAMAGYDVTVVALRGSVDDATVLAAQPHEPQPVPLAGAVGAVGTVRAGVRWLLLPWYIRNDRRRFQRTAAELARSSGPFDVVHAHDFDTLPLAERLSSEWGVPLVYDAHELWMHRVRHGRPTPFRRVLEGRAERRLGSRAEAVFTVGEEIAEWLRGAYGWSHVRVVRNSATATGAPVMPGPPTGLLYAGRVAAGRDLDTLAAAAPALPLPVTVMGPAQTALATRLARVQNLSIRPPVPVPDVGREMCSHGVALVLASDGPLSYRWSLPNKLFQAVVSGVPVVATDLPAQARLVREHGLGTLYRAGDVGSLVRAVEQVLAGWEAFASAARDAAPAMTWDVDAAVMLSAYDRLTGSASRGGRP